MSARKVQDTEQIYELLSEKGEFTAIDWLVHQNRLMEEDVEDWLAGDLEYLSDALLGNSEKIRERLNHLLTIANAMDIQVGNKEYQQTNSKESCKLSSSKELAFLMAMRFYRKKAEPQFDLFLDNSEITTENAVIESLEQGNWSQAKKQLDELYRLNPGNAKAPALEKIQQFCSVLVEQKSDQNTESLLRQKQEFESEILPLVMETMGRHAAAFIKSVWQIFANSLSKYLVDSQGSDETNALIALCLHALFEAGDWKEFVHCWRDYANIALPEEQIKEAIFVFFEEDKVEAWWLICQQIWQQKRDVLEWIEHLDVPALYIEWQQFNDLQDRYEMEKEAELPDEAFATFIFIREFALLFPLLEKRTEEIQHVPQAIQQTYELLKEKVQKGKTRWGDQDEMATRKALMNIDPVLMWLYRQR